MIDVSPSNTVGKHTWFDSKLNNSKYENLYDVILALCRLCGDNRRNTYFQYDIDNIQPSF